MNKFIIVLAISIFSFANVFSQIERNDGYNYQGYLKNTPANETVRASFYIAGEEFNPNTVFNQSNYPVWYKENATIQVENGILNYRMERVNTDSLVKYRDRLYLYVTVNGTPFDKVLISSVPYSTHSTLADFSVHSNSSDTSIASLRSVSSINSRRADTALLALRSQLSDSAVSSAVSSLAINSLHSLISDSALTVTNESITSEKIADRSINTSHFNTVNAASNQTVLSYVNGNFVWASTDYVNVTTTQKTLTIPTQINDNTFYFISQVAQDYSIIEPTPRYGRRIRIVNASTANAITVNWSNLFGGAVVITPRSSVEFMYVDTEWIKL